MAETGRRREGTTHRRSASGSEAGSASRARAHRALGRSLTETRGRGDAGWTFVETLVVITIVLILTSSVGFMAFRYVDKARLVAARDQIENLVMALDTYYMDCGTYPTSEQGVGALWEKPVLEPVPAGWNGPYLMKRPGTDPWGGSYHYEVPGPNGLPFAVLSYGADGNPGGETGDADIVSWQE